MGFGTIYNLKVCWPNLHGQRLSAIKLAIQRIALHSLDHQYQVLIHSTKPKDKTNTFQKAQEAYWYETACLIEESRKLKLRFPNIVIPPPSLTNASKPAQALENGPIYTQILKNTVNRPPSVISIIILSLFLGISIGAGILWLVAPHLINS